MTKRILYIVGEYPSVTETFVQREIEGLRERGMFIDVCPLGRLGPGELVGAALRAPWKLYGLLNRDAQELGSYTRRRRIGSAVKALAIARRYPRVEHLHAHFLGAPALTTYYVSRVLHIPYSLTAHAHDIYTERTPPALLRKACFRTTCTEANVHYLAAGEPTAPFVLVRHGIDTTCYIGDRVPNSGICRILAVGRYVEKKGFRYLVEACAILRSRNFPFRCIIVGEGLEMEDSHRQTKLSDERSFLEFRPFLSHDELKRIYLNSDILVVPSIIADNGDRDGVPNVILEAMASSLPVVATDAGAIGEVIKDRQTGLLVPQRDPYALARAIVELMSDSDLRDSLTANSLAFVRSEFHSEHWLDVIESEFLRSISRNPQTYDSELAMDVSQQSQITRMVAKYASDDEFQFWDAFSNVGLTPYEEQALNRYVDKNVRVLDIGCGGGREAVFLASRAVEFCAIDAVPRMVERTKQRLNSLGVSAQVLCADICDGIPFEGQFDVALLLEQVYQHIPRRAERVMALSDIRDRLTNDGTVLLTVFNEGDIKIGNRLAWLWATNWELARSAVVDGVSLLDLRYLPSTDEKTLNSTVKPTPWQNLLILRWTAAYLFHAVRRKLLTKFRRSKAQDKDIARCKQVSRANPVKTSDGYFLLPVLALHEIVEELESAGFEVCDIHALLEGDVPFSRRAKYGSPLCLIVAKTNRTTIPK